MMLPQHKERIIEHRSRDNDQIKPLLHEDEWEAVYQNIGISYRFTEEANFEIFELNSKRVVSGIISKVDELGKKVRVEWESGHEWIDRKKISCSAIIIMKQSAEELELVKKYAEMPLHLDVIEEDKKRIDESGVILKRELKFYLSALQDRITADIYELKKELRDCDIKIIEQKRTKDNLFISYSIRKYQH